MSLLMVKWKWAGLLTVSVSFSLLSNCIFFFFFGNSNDGIAKNQRRLHPHQMSNKPNLFNQSVVLEVVKVHSDLEFCYTELTGCLKLSSSAKSNALKHVINWQKKKS